MGEKIVHFFPKTKRHPAVEPRRGKEIMQNVDIGMVDGMGPYLSPTSKPPKCPSHTKDVSKRNLI